MSLREDRYIFLVTDRSIYCHMTISAMNYLLYRSKLSVFNCKECPYKLPAGVWEKNTCKWSDLQYGDVYSYLIENPCTLPFFLINNL